MKLPITKYGMPQVVFFAADFLGLAIIFALTIDNPAIFWPLEIAAIIMLVWTLAFFRDPKRKIPDDKDILLAPADGKITDIDMIDDPDCKGKKLLRIGILLNIFNVHINRAPCRVRIENINYSPGQFKNALNPDSAKLNESNDLKMTRLDEPAHPIIVRQISGAIARRIICDTKKGDQLAAGQKFGMIKFGSRTEISIPEDISAQTLVEIGQKVKAGLTPLIKYTKND